ncbi:MAG: hypothetical protein QOF78_3826 [Phycisphaerales bacterium]|jgi:DNA invertase Pin-like site-specific DNA recombinase|nr:hypothetical protein [Phycisphaerales bacterium]
MKYENNLTGAMKKFLRAMRDRPVVLSRLAAQERVEPRRLASWLRSPRFQAPLNEMLREIRLRMRVELELLAAAALHCLAEMVSDKEKRDEKLLAICKTILEAFHRHRRHQRLLATRRGKRAQTLPPGDLCHPDAKADEDELLAIFADEEEVEAAAEKEVRSAIAN